MKTLNKKLMAVAMLALAITAAPTVNAKSDNSSNNSSSDKSVVTTPVVTTPVASLSNVLTTFSSPLTFQGTNGAVTIEFSGAAPVRVAVGANDIADQNYDTVGSRVQTVFGVSALNSTGYKVDDATKIMTGNNANFISPVAYNYLAVHFGQQEAFFDFGANAVPVNTVFTIATTAESAAGLSNFRAYKSNVVVNNPMSIVPIPAAAWLFGSGLVGLIGLGRKKSV